MSSLTITSIEDGLYQARTAITAKQFEQALNAIEAVLALSPDNAEAMNLAIEVGERDEQARLDEIERTQQSAPTTSPQEESTPWRNEHYENARRHLLDQQFDLALADVTLALLDNPADGEILALEREIQNAMLTAKKNALSNSAATLSAILLTARRYLEREKYELALEEVNAGLKIDVSHSELLWLRNTIVEQMQTQKLRELHERRSALLQNIRGLFAKTEFQQAIELTNRGLAEFPDDVELKSLASEIDEAHTKWTELKRFEKITSDGNDRAKRARQLMRVEQLDAAIQEVALGLAIDPYNQNLKKLESELWTVLAKQEEARRQEEAQEAKDREFARVTIHLVAAQEFSMYGQYGRALDEIAAAYVIDPINPEIRQLETNIRSQQQRGGTGSLKLVYTDTGTHPRTLKQNQS